MAKDGDGFVGVVVAAFVLGAVAGAVTALLAAPATGEETRDVLGRKAREGRDKANEAARHGREFIRRKGEQLAEAVDRGIEAYKQPAEAAADGNDQPAAKDEG